jgi:AcrR family transcriptional regulator
MVTTKTAASVRERLLAAANELFYEEGVHTVGIDRVIERAGVAKASLYSAFGSKDELVRAYLDARATARRERIERRVASAPGPRARILAIFDLLGEIVASPTFRGCAFVNASAEGPRDAGVTRICNDQRAWLAGLFAGFARELGAPEAERIGRQLALLYDGASVGASMDRDPSIAKEARRMAEVLLDAELVQPRARTRPSRTRT